MKKYKSFSFLVVILLGIVAIPTGNQALALSCISTTLQEEVDTLAHNIIQRSARDLVNFYKAKKTPCHFIKHRITVLSSFIDDPKSLLQ